MLRATSVLSCLAVWVCAEGSAYADGKLARARREAASGSNHSSDSASSDSHDGSRSRARRHQHHHHHHHHHHHDCSRGFFEDIVCEVFGGCSCPDPADEWAVSYYESDPSPAIGYAPYPYASPLAPYLLETEVQVASASAALDARLRSEAGVGRPFAGHLMLDAGFLAGIGHAGLDTRILTPSPFELGARASLLWEPAARDYSLFGAGELGVRFAEFSHLTARLFAGFVYFGQPGEMIVGPEVGFGMDVFLGRPWVLSARLVASAFGDTFVPQARVQLGYLFGRNELFVAYEHLSIGSVDLSAPMLGLRLWL